METLPVEMVERIVQQLTPQDLARCSAVSRKWREIFNQDWMWKPHCDPELEEPLRTIPCDVTPAFVASEAGNSTLSPISCWILRFIPFVATPAFVAPEAENSTLSPNSHWKLAFMREKHLWKNWRRKDIMKSKGKIIKSENNTIASIDFLTDTLVVVWYANTIEILDVNVKEAILVAKTDTLVKIGDDDHCYVRGTNMLLVKRHHSIDVFNVDIMKKYIELKHNIDFHWNHGRYEFKDDLCISFDEEGSELIIIDLNTGEILKKEPSPLKNAEIEKEITTSTTSDFVAVTFGDFDVNDRIDYHNIYIYSLEELTFLPGPVAVMSGCGEMFFISLHSHWLALTENNTVKVVNIHTREVLLNYEENFRFRNGIATYACYNGFLFCSWSDRLGKSCVKYYSPEGRTLTIVYESSDIKSFGNIHKSFLAIYDYPSEVLESVLKLSDQTVEKCAISVTRGCRINPSCTKVLSREWLNDSSRPTWRVIHLW